MNLEGKAAFVTGASGGIGAAVSRSLVAAVAALDEARTRWPDALESFIGLRVPLERFQEAFDHRGSKATLVLSET